MSCWFELERECKELRNENAILREEIEVFNDTQSDLLPRDGRRG